MIDSLMLLHPHRTFSGNRHIRPEQMPAGVEGQCQASGVMVLGTEVQWITLCDYFLGFLCCLEKL